MVAAVLNAVTEPNAQSDSVTILLALFSMIGTIVTAVIGAWVLVRTGKVAEVVSKTHSLVNSQTEQLVKAVQDERDAAVAAVRSERDKDVAEAKRK